MASPLGRLFSSLSGSQDATETFSSRNLQRDIQRLSDERNDMAPARTRSIGQAGNAESRLQRALGGQASAAVAAREGALPVSFRGAINQATRRMRARQSIVNRGDAAIRNQSLKDRIQVARGSASRRGSLHNALQQAANIREGVNTGVQDANQRIRESRANMFGSIAGAAVRIGKDYFGRSGTVSPETDQGTASADFYNMDPIDYDPMAPQPTVYG